MDKLSVYHIKYLVTQKIIHKTPTNKEPSAICHEIGTSFRVFLHILFIDLLQAKRNNNRLDKFSNNE